MAGFFPPGDGRLYQIDIKNDKLVSKEVVGPREQLEMRVVDVPYDQIPAAGETPTYATGERLFSVIRDYANSIYRKLRGDEK